MNEFQERLQELLDEFEISRLTLAKSLGVASTTINGYFNNGYYPHIDIAIAMAKYFDCSLDYLFGLSDERKIKHLNNNEFIDNFKNAIDENRLSIAKAMAELNMSEYNFYRWKKFFPKTINLIEIAKHFDISVDFLVGNKLQK